MKVELKHTLLALITTTALALGACNTVEGVGEDLESAGDKAEEITRND